LRTERSLLEVFRSSPDSYGLEEFLKENSCKAWGAYMKKFFITNWPSFAEPVFFAMLQVACTSST